MANPVSGHGGTITITGESVQPKVGSWTMTKRATLADTTHAASSGWRNKTLVVREATLSFEAFWDSANSVEDMSVDAGDTFTAALKLGDSTWSYSSTGWIVADVQITGCDHQGVVRFTVNAESTGSISDPASS